MPNSLVLLKTKNLIMCKADWHAQHLNKLHHIQYLGYTTEAAGSFETSVSVQDIISCWITIINFQIPQKHMGLYLVVRQMFLHHKILSYIVTSIWNKPIAPKHDRLTRQTSYLRRNTVAISREAYISYATLCHSNRGLSWRFNVPGNNQTYLGLHMFAGF